MGVPSRGRIYADFEVAVSQPWRVRQPNMPIVSGLKKWNRVSWRGDTVTYYGKPRANCAARSLKGVTVIIIHILR